MSANALRQPMKKTNNDHPLIYPAHLDNLLEKSFAFRVKFQPFYKQASVVKLTQDKNVMQQIEGVVIPTKATAMTPHKDVDCKGKSTITDEDLNHNNTLTQTSNPISNVSAAQN